MPRLPRVTSLQVVRVLERIGFALDRQRGSHQIYLDPNGQRTTVPIHAGETLRPKTLRSILRDAGLTVDQFTRLLKG